MAAEHCTIPKFPVYIYGRQLAFPFKSVCSLLCTFFLRHNVLRSSIFLHSRIAQASTRKPTKRASRSSVLPPAASSGVECHFDYSRSKTITSARGSRARWMLIPRHRDPPYHRPKASLSAPGISTESEKPHDCPRWKGKVEKCGKVAERPPPLATIS